MASGKSYVGPAAVERSNADELVLAYSFAGATPELRHAKVSNPRSHELPLLPLGAQVWLSVTEVDRNLEVFPLGKAIAVGSAEDGPLLFGYRSGTDTPGLPPAKRVDGDSCIVESPICPGDSTSYVKYAAGELQGDQTVVINDSASGTVQLDGITYDVAVGAVEYVMGQCHVNDFFPPDVTFELRAQDLDALIAGLVPGSPPTCGVGNDESPGLFGYFRDSERTDYEGPAIFQGKATDDEGGYVFGLTDGATDDFGLWPGESGLSLPSEGTAWWLSAPSSDLRALFDAHDGELQAVTGSIALPLDPTLSSALQDWLGVAVTAEKVCEYDSNYEGGELSTWSLWDLILSTSPPVRAHAESLALIEVAGVRYDVWTRAVPGDRIELAIFKHVEP